ncbi:MAG: hypothetical protein ACRESK_10605 [Gammaproteobacteria bacterium]
MKHINAILIVWSLMIAPVASGAQADYTGRNYVAPACELFAQDASQAAQNFGAGAALPELLDLIEGAPVSDDEKDRAFQAIQFVWKNRLDNPVLAYTVAMGLCLKPKQEMAPMDEPWLTSPRTSREHF